MAPTAYMHWVPSLERMGALLEDGFSLEPPSPSVSDLLDANPLQPLIGQVPFFEAESPRTRELRMRLGGFGVAVTREWAVKRGMQRVLYLAPESDVAFTFRKQLRGAQKDIETDFLKTAVFDQGRLVMGGPVMGKRFYCHDLEDYTGVSLASPKYQHLRVLYGYMESDVRSEEAEWRIVQDIPHPAMSATKTDPDLMPRFRKGRNLRESLIVEPQDLAYFTCPKWKLRALKQALPLRYHEVPVHGYWR